jgi:hypothetical protein
MKILTILYKTNNQVIPAKAGIQYYLVFPGFRAALRLHGMTSKVILQGSHLVFVDWCAAK